MPLIALHAGYRVSDLAVVYPRACGNGLPHTAADVTALVWG